MIAFKRTNERPFSMWVLYTRAHVVDFLKTAICAVLSGVRSEGFVSNQSQKKIYKNNICTKNKQYRKFQLSPSREETVNIILSVKELGMNHNAKVKHKLNPKARAAIKHSRLCANINKTTASELATLRSLTWGVEYSVYRKTKDRQDSY